MLIKELKLKNFRQYKKVDLEFSTDKEKNLTVIIGENGYGKTTLVRAFIWCLYGVNDFNDQVLLNHDVALEMDVNEEEKVKVEMKLEHNHATYRIRTTQTYKKDMFGKIFAVNEKPQVSINKQTDSNTYTLPQSLIKSEIEKILKDELKDYFFYDGENNKIESVSKRKNIKNAVTDMMGIKTIETLKTYFDPNSSNGVINALNEQLEGDDFELEPLKEEYNNFLTEKDRLEKIVIENKKEINRLKIQLEEKEMIIDANIDVQDLQIEKKRLHSDNDKILSKMDNEFDSLINCINGKKENNALLKTLFAYCYEKNDLRNFEDNSSFNSKKSLSHISEEAIDQLISRGYCLCGTKITNNEEALKHLNEAKEHMEPHDFGKYLADFCSAEESNLSLSATIKDNATDIGNDILEKIEDLENNRERLRELNTKLEGRNDIGEIQIEANNIRNQISQLEGANDFINSDQLPNIVWKISIKEKELKKASSDSKSNELINKCIEYANAVYDATCKKISKSQKEIRENLQNSVDEIFCTMYHGNRRIEIDEDFKVITLTDNNKLDNSTGIETVKNFAFVAGLLNLVKKHVINGDSEFSDESEIDEDYPLIMDAPFSNTDEEHIRNICSTLPLYCNQLFIVVIEKDYNVAKDDLKNKIGKKYQIKKISETSVTIEEVVD